MCRNEKASRVNGITESKLRYRSKPHTQSARPLHYGNVTAHRYENCNELL